MFTFTNCSVSKRFCPENRAFSLPRSVKKSFQNSFSEFVQILLSTSGSGFQPASAWPRSWITNPAASSLLLSDPSSAWNEICIFHPTAKLFMPPFAPNRALKNIACTFASGFLWWLNSRFSRLLSMNHKLFCETCCAYFLCSGHEPTKRRSSVECTTDGCSACRHCVLCRVVWVGCTRRAASGPPCRHSPSVRAIYR